MGGQWNEGTPDHQDLHHHLGEEGIGALHQGAHQGALHTSYHQKEGGMMMAGPLDQVVGAS